MAAIIFHTWLTSGQDYDTGVRLYEQFGANSSLKRLFAMGNTAFTSSKLVQEITLLSQADEKTLPAPMIIADLPKAPIPDEIKQLTEKRIQLFKETSYLHSQLIPAPSAEARLELALQIKKNWRVIDSMWAQIEHFEQHGKLPEVPAPVPIQTEDPVKLMERRRNLITYISKHKNNPKKTDQVNAWQAERLEIERKLSL